MNTSIENASSSQLPHIQEILWQYDPLFDYIPQNTPSLENHNQRFKRTSKDVIDMTTQNHNRHNNNIIRLKTKSNSSSKIKLHNGQLRLKRVTHFTTFIDNSSSNCENSETDNDDSISQPPLFSSIFKQVFTGNLSDLLQISNASTSSTSSPVATCNCPDHE